MRVFTQNNDLRISNTNDHNQENHKMFSYIRNYVFTFFQYTTIYKKIIIMILL